MSHNANKVNAKEPNRAGVVSQALEDLSDVPTLSATNGQVLGWSAGPTVDAIDMPSPYDIAGSMWQSGGGWGGGHIYSVGDGAYWRAASLTLNLDATKISLQSGTWITQWTLQAGTYLMKWDIPFQASASSSSAVLRLKDITNNQYLGAKIQIGDGRSSNHFMTLVSPSSATTYHWEFLSITGAIYLPNAQTYQSFQAAFLEV